MSAIITADLPNANPALPFAVVVTVGNHFD